MAEETVTPLLTLPALILTSHVFDSLDADAKRALRSACKLIRLVVNGEVQLARISACHIVAGRQPLCLARVASEFSQLKNLVLSDTTRNRIGGALLAEFLAGANAQASPGSQLRHLDVKQCHFLNATDMQLLVAACPQLEQLALSRWADGAHLRTVQPLGLHLTELDLGDSSTNITSITDKSLAHLPALPVLTTLSLRRCVSITDEGISNLNASRLPRLCNLDLSSTRVAGVSGFSTLHLASIVLRNCRAFGDAGLGAVCATHARTLRSLALSDTSVQPSGGSMWHLAQATGLELLDLGSSWEVDTEGLAALACCTELQELRLGNFNLRHPLHLHNRNINPGGQAAAGADAVWAADAGGGPQGDDADTSPAVESILPALANLSLGGMFCQHGLDLLLPRLRSLRLLELTGLSTARDEVLSLLGGAGAARLEDLRLANSGPELSSAGLLALSRLPALKRLTLVACPAATDATVRQLTACVQRAGRQLQVHVYCSRTGIKSVAAGGCSWGGGCGATTANWRAEAAAAVVQVGA